MYLQKFTNNELDDFKKGQEVLINMLQYVDKICRENDLYYWGVGGILIGAVRNKKMIDFDGDIDIAMTEKDYNKFKSIWLSNFNNNLEKRYWLQDRDTDNKYKCNISKIRYLDAHYCDYNVRKWHNGIQIDIFIFKEKENLLVPTYPLLDIKTTNRNDIFPLKELEFETFKIFVPNNYYKYCLENWGNCPPPMLPKNKQYPIEGKISFIVPDWMKEMYRELY